MSLSGHTKTSLGRTATGTGITQAFHQFPWLAISWKRFWALVIIGSIVLVAFGGVLHVVMKDSLTGVMAGGLQAVLRAEAAALERWFEAKALGARAAAYYGPVRKHAQELAQTAEGLPSPVERLLGSSAMKSLRGDLRAAFGDRDVRGFALIDRNGMVLASHHDKLIGLQLEADELPRLSEVFVGKTVIAMPFNEGALVRTHNGGQAPRMAVMAPIYSFESESLVESILEGPGQSEIIAALVFLIDPNGGFSEVLSVAHDDQANIGQTGHTYAFDRQGRMLSKCRSIEALQSIGLLSKEPNATAILTVKVRDPGGDMTTGHSPTTSIENRPLTQMAAVATSGRSGVDAIGYRDYRGKTVIGAWTWLPDYDIGVATEMELAEASRLLQPVWLTFGAMVVAMICAGLITVINSWHNVRLRRHIDEVRQLGQYTLLEMIGEGGMGEVYRARHAMLRRPTAVKMLKGEGVDDEAITRFEQEVQQTCELTHPNTIEIYDFGRTPEGYFYYAMEYLEGLTLTKLVAMEGTVSPGRTIYLLKQVCGSLAEAHEIGLIHRDIKSQNIIVCERGGVYDVIKVLDFGLVRDVTMRRRLGKGASEALMGTPRYIAPERLEDPGQASPRTDLFSVGAVAFLMLTGREAFLGSSVEEICGQVLHSRAPRVSDCASQPVPAALDDLVARCLSRDPSGRPRDALAMLRALRDIEDDADPWGPEAARAWWLMNAHKIKSVRTRHSSDELVDPAGTDVTAPRASHPET
ncbi:MAG: protein kinase domain-containing protein [Planctomycetota bacterium]|jgi:hypothetical protein